MTTRPRSEIMRDLNALMAELNAAMQNERAARAPEGAPVPSDEWKSDISPKLTQALDQTRSSSPDQSRPIVPRYDEPETHDDIRAKARAYREETRDAFQASNREHMERRREHKERLKDYTRTDDPDWPPDSTWMGTGDHKLIE